MIAIDRIQRIINALAAEGHTIGWASDLENAGATAGCDSGKFGSYGVTKMTSNQGWKDAIERELGKLETKRTEYEQALLEMFGTEHTEAQRVAVEEFVNLRRQLAEAEENLWLLGAAKPSGK